MFCCHFLLNRAEAAPTYLKVGPLRIAGARGAAIAPAGISTPGPLMPRRSHGAFSANRLEICPSIDGTAAAKRRSATPLRTSVSSSLSIEEVFMNRLSLGLSPLGLNGLSRTLTTVAQGLRSTLGSLPAQALAWHERRKGLKALSALTDHQLRDIGVCRDEIVMVAYGLKDPRETPAMVTVSSLATKTVSAVKAADNDDRDPCVGCAA
jgi:uncharacterized protein YjiS (DUF1127 family)